MHDTILFFSPYKYLLDPSVVNDVCLSIGISEATRTFLGALPILRATAPGVVVICTCISFHGIINYLRLSFELLAIVRDFLESLLEKTGKYLTVGKVQVLTW